MHQAVFCLEEVLLHQPSNVSIQLLLADTLYSLGGPSNWRLARGYYSGVIEAMESTQLRALYGVCACTAQLMDSQSTRGNNAGTKRGKGETDSGGGETDADGETLATLVAEQLVELHARCSPEKLSVVKAMLKSQNIL